MLRLLIGGSPCTHWSIAQTKKREIEPSGIGWELFLNFLIALEKYRPDYFLYENNKSMSKAIRAEITRCFGFEPICINSSKVSAQNRERLYWLGKREPDGTYSRVVVEQPEDLGILLRDILESGISWREKSYTLDAHYHKTAGVFNPQKQHSYSRHMAAEPVCTTRDGKAFCLKANYSKASSASAVDSGHFPAPMAAEPVRIGEIGEGRQGERIYGTNGKGCSITAQGGGPGRNSGLYAISIADAGRTDGRTDGRTEYLLLAS